MTREEFEQLAGAGVILLDGATGSNLTKAGMPKGVSTELWVLEHPDILANLQKAYVEAGSQIVYAPTFGANRLKLADYGRENEVEELNARLVDISKKSACRNRRADRGRFFLHQEKCCSQKAISLMKSCWNPTQSR
ncbi:MAG: homocysteine S-methyltransferase family protein [Fusicatenibacter saccharivorans]